MLYNFHIYHFAWIQLVSSIIPLKYPKGIDFPCTQVILTWTLQKFTPTFISHMVVAWKSIKSITIDAYYHFSSDCTHLPWYSTFHYSPNHWKSILFLAFFVKELHLIMGFKSNLLLQSCRSIYCATFRSVMAITPLCIVELRRRRLRKPSSPSHFLIPMSVYSP